MNIISPYEFINIREWFITGRGLVIAVNLKENGFENVRNKDMWDLFMGKEVMYKSQLHQIRGIETMGMPDRLVKEAGFMMTPIEETVAKDEMIRERQQKLLEQNSKRVKILKDELQDIHKKPE